ncbi:hypothetical protein [Lichenicoccus sp.]|uniref:hypothetical protein n=1 Tax=Lichenicoccus sp. TaxID=2781899 RepID=UPI003D122066
MSGSVGLSELALSNAERVDIRRFCGYPAYGSGDAGSQSWRFFQAYGTLEYRLSNFAPEELQVIRQYLASLYVLELGVVAAAANLDTDKAAVWTHNRSEVADRAKLFDEWRGRLASFIGVPLDPGAGAGARILI